MEHLKRILVVVFFSTFLQISLRAQDVIYMVDNSKMSKIDVLDIKEGQVKYQRSNSTDPQELSLKESYISFVFYRNGYYDILPKPTDKADIPKGRPMTNLVIDRKGAILTANQEVVIEENRVVLLNFENQRVKRTEKVKSDIVAVIRKNGSHELLSKPEEIKTIMQNAKSKIVQYFGEPTVEDLVEIDFEDYKNRALYKADLLNFYIKKISNKQTPSAEASKSIEEALSLFLSDTCIVEVASMNTGNIVTRNIKSYLTLLKALPYQEVEIEWVDIQYASNFKEGPDGNYYATVVIRQRFKGKIDNKTAYEDVTEKNIQIVLKAFDVIEEGKLVRRWDVFLSDIKVVSIG